VVRFSSCHSVHEYLFGICGSSSLCISTLISDGLYIKKTAYLDEVNLILASLPTFINGNFSISWFYSKLTKIHLLVCCSQSIYLKFPFLSRFIDLTFYTTFMLCVLCFYNNHTEFSFWRINHNGTAYAISASVTPWTRSNFHGKMRPQNVRPLAYSKYNIVIKEIT
jgi:hypothetical protein